MYYEIRYVASTTNLMILPLGDPKVRYDSSTRAPLLFESLP